MYQNERKHDALLVSDVFIFCIYLSVLLFANTSNKDLRHNLSPD